MLTRGTLPKLRLLSAKFSDPDGSYWGMKNNLKSRIRLQRKKISRNFLVKLLKKKVGTGEIEAAARRNIYGEDAWIQIRNKDIEKEVMRVLRMRIKTSEKKIKRT